jgi:phosphoribosyl-ATP pyrophosphohydrolase
VNVLAEVETVLRDRLLRRPAGSYSLTLLTDSELARRKIMEEAFELCLELGREPVDADRTAGEAADLIFHTLAGLVGAGVGLGEVLDELAARRGAPPAGGQQA